MLLHLSLWILMGAPGHASGLCESPLCSSACAAYLEAHIQSSTDAEILNSELEKFKTKVAVNRDRLEKRSGHMPQFKEDASLRYVQGNFYAEDDAADTLSDILVNDKIEEADRLATLHEHIEDYLTDLGSIREGVWISGRIFRGQREIEEHVGKLLEIVSRNDRELRAAHAEAFPYFSKSRLAIHGLGLAIPASLVASSALVVWQLAHGQHLPLGGSLGLLLSGFPSYIWYQLFRESQFTYLCGLFSTSARQEYEKKVGTQLGDELLVPMKNTENLATWRPKSPDFFGFSSVGFVVSDWQLDKLKARQAGVRRQTLSSWKVWNPKSNEALAWRSSQVGKNFTSVTVSCSMPRLPLQSCFLF